jgi:endonuclease YncB( thermonuclease family)
MPGPTVKNSGGVPFLTLKGYFIVRANQKPDGDTLAFAAGRKYAAGGVSTNVPVVTTGKTVNIRLQSIDAPEKSQPLGAACRNALLKHVGLRPAASGLTDTDFSAAGDLQRVPGWIATHGMDGNRRPLGYVFRANPGFSHGKIISAADVLEVLKSSANYVQAARGWAFPAFYDNTDEAHAALFAAAARKARKAKAGVWKVDSTTTGFVPTRDALGIDGALAYPKFYRRVEKWKTAKPNAKAFIHWLKQQDDGKKLVQGAQPSPVRLWQLFEVAGTRKVAVPYDVTRLWFSE